MIYYKSGDKLIQYNPETNVYKLRNTIERIDTRISKEDFILLDAKQIKKQEFSRLMNIFFKDIKHEWVHDHSKFRKLPNFESNGHNLSTNYILGKDIPYHTSEKSYYSNFILVYHWGKVYYHTVSYNGDDRGCLLDINTLKHLRWAQLKHCAPIQNINTKKIQ